MNDQEKERPAAGGPADSPASAPQQSMGSAPAEESFGTAPPAGDGTGTFGSAPGATETVGKAPQPRGNRSVPLLVGGGLAIVVILAAVFGFLIK
jgi:hypothetical protein